MKSQRRSLGFTLIELLVVVAILVILAGVILPKLDRVQLKANKAVAASNISDVSRYIQTYRVMHNLYPDGFDSLLSGTTLWEGAAVGDAGLDPQLVGGPVPASPEKLKTATFGSLDEIRSLSRMGITTFYDLNAASGDLPGSRFEIPRVIAVGDTYATLNITTDANGLINGGDGDAINIARHFYPNGTVPTDKRILVCGVGPRSSMLGDVLQETPFYSNTDPTKYYHRFLAVFELSTGGSRAELKGVVGADADLLDEEIKDYYE